MDVEQRVGTNLELGKKCRPKKSPTEIYPKLNFLCPSRNAVHSGKPGPHGPGRLLRSILLAGDVGVRGHRHLAVGVVVADLDDHVRRQGKVPVPLLRPGGIQGDGIQLHLTE